MPTELPPPKKPIHTPNDLPDLWLTRTLNWLAVIVGIGLCLYVMNYGISSPSLPNSPSASVSTKG